MGTLIEEVDGEPQILIKEKEDDLHIATLTHYSTFA